MKKSSLRLAAANVTEDKDEVFDEDIQLELAFTPMGPLNSPKEVIGSVTFSNLPDRLDLHGRMATAEIDDGIDSFLEAAELYAASGIEKLRPRHMTLGQLIEQNATFSKGSRVVSIFDGTNDPGSICEYFDKDSPMVFMPFQELSLTNPGPSQIISLDFEKRVYLDILAGHYFSWALTPSTDLAKHRADKEFNERAHFVEKTHAILMDAKSKRAPVTVAFIDLGKRDLMGRVGHLLKSRDLIFLDESKWLVEDNQERFTLARIDSL